MDSNGERGGWRFRRSLMAPFLIAAAALAGAEFVVNEIPSLVFAGLNLNPQSPAYISLFDSVNAAVRMAFVPFVLFLIFYVLASRLQINLSGAYSSVAISIFLGTFVVLLGMVLVRVSTNAPPTGYTSAEFGLQGIGGSIWTSLNHTFIGFSGVFLWQFLKNRPPAIAANPENAPQRAHGLEDLSIVGVVMVAIYFWEYLARAYQTMYPSGAGNQVASVLAYMLAAGTPSYYTVTIWQQVFFLAVLPFALFFLLARYLALNPFTQGRKIALILFAWGLFLRTIPPYFYIYTAKLFDPNAFPGATLGSTFADEFLPMNFMGILASSLTFLFLGITAVVFAFYWGEAREGEVPNSLLPPSSPLAAPAKLRRRSLALPRSEKTIYFLTWPTFYLGSGTTSVALSTRKPEPGPS